MSGLGLQRTTEARRAGGDRLALRGLGDGRPLLPQHEHRDVDAEEDDVDERRRALSRTPCCRSIENGQFHEVMNGIAVVDLMRYRLVERPQYLSAAVMNSCGMIAYIKQEERERRRCAPPMASAQVVGRSGFGRAHLARRRGAIITTVISVNQISRPFGARKSSPSQSQHVRHELPGPLLGPEPTSRAAAVPESVLLCVSLPR